jgi:hypothetical protein
MWGGGQDIRPEDRLDLLRPEVKRSPDREKDAGPPPEFSIGADGPIGLPRTGELARGAR